MNNRREAFNGNRQQRRELQDQRLMNLVDQTQPARRAALTSPIEAGRYEDFGVDSDAASLFHAVNEDVRTEVPGTQPVEPHSPGALSQVVPSAGVRRTHANDQQSSDRQDSFGVQFRSGLGIPSASGFSSYGMNEPSGGQLRPIPLQVASPYVLEQLRLVPQQWQFEQQNMETFLRRRLGDNPYELQWQKSYRTFIDAGIDRDIALTYASLLLHFIDVKDFEKVKCSLCGARHDIGSRISHTSNCPVQEGYDQAESRMLRENEGQSEPRGTAGHVDGCEGDNMVPPRPSLPQRPSETIRLTVVEEGSLEDRNRYLLDAERTENSAGGRSETPWITQPPRTSATPLVSQQGPSGDSDITQAKTKNNPDVFEKLQQMGYSAERIREIRRISGKELNSSVEEFLREEELYNDNPTGVRSARRQPWSYHTARTNAGSQQNTYHSVNWKQPEYGEFQARLRSFENWPGGAVQTPDTLAETGMYYTGHGDVCRCFACNGTLQKWEPSDNAWFEHARLYPECPYVRQERGQAFIDSVLQICRGKEKNLTSSNQANGLRMETIALEDPLASPVAQRVLEMGYTKEKVREAVMKANGRAESGAGVTVEQILNILLGEEDGVGSLTTNFRTQSLVSEPASSVNRMDASICGACDERKIGVSQYDCGHIVCYTCAPNGQMGGSCKICGQKVVKVVAYDPNSKSKKT